MSSAKPTTLGELQLYKVLQRANLLSYYEAFISQGGDDVQQLCEAGEEEFLEIMALVGMASKPLHVRRLQKALQEWVTRPTLFRATNIHYLPAQSISLTSLGIDTRDLILPPQSSPRNSTSPSFPRDTTMQDDSTLTRSTNMNGSTTTAARPSNGLSNVFRLDDNQRKVNGNKTDIDSETEQVSDNVSSAILDAITEKWAAKSPMTLLEKNDVIAQMKNDRSLRDLAMAIENNHHPKMELLIRDYVKTAQNREGETTSNHEVLITDAAIKLCMADERWLLKKSELMTTAEKIAIEAESKLSSRRRSSTHLHGSCSQTRLQEINQRLQSIKSQRANLHKKLSEAQSSKNVIKENECQNLLGHLSRDELPLLQEKRELTEKLQSENRDSPSATVGVESSFSSELADLAKAHNLSFGNLQSMPSTSQWPSRENAPNMQNGINGIGNAAKSDKSSPSRTGTTSPPPLISANVTAVSPERPHDLLQVKREGVEGREDSAFPSSTDGAVRASKRKLSPGTGSGESKKFVTSVEGKVE